MGQIRRLTYRDRTTGERLTSAIWWIRWYRDGKRCEESSGSDKKGVAIELLRRREGAVADGASITAKVGKIRGHKTREDAKRRRIELHLTPVFGGWRMTAIAPADVQAYIAKRKAETESLRRAHTVTRTERCSRCLNNAARSPGCRTGRSIANWHCSGACLPWPSRAASSSGRRRLRC
jgi:hypothetical protein